MGSGASKKKPLAQACVGAHVTAFRAEKDSPLEPPTATGSLAAGSVGSAALSAVTPLSAPEPQPPGCLEEDSEEVVRETARVQVACNDFHMIPEQRVPSTIPAPDAAACFAPVLPAAPSECRHEASQPSQVGRAGVITSTDDLVQTLHRLRSGGVATVRAAVLMLQSGLTSGCPSTRLAALQLYLEALCTPDGANALPEFELQAAFEKLFENIVFLLADTDTQIAVLAAEAAIASAQSSVFGLEAALEQIYSLLECAKNSEGRAELCGSMCAFLTSALQVLLPSVVDACGDAAMVKVHLQAALWDSAHLVRQALTGAFGPVRQQLASSLAVAVYCKLGVDESSLLLEGLPHSVVSFLFEQFAEAEDDPPTPMNDGSPISPFRRIKDDRSTIMDEILEEVGFAFADDVIHGKLAHRSKEPACQSSIDSDLFEMGFSLDDDLLKWAKGVLVE